MNQRDRALRIANVVRLAGAAWKREIAALPYREGLVAVAQALEPRKIPEGVGALRVDSCLRAIRGVAGGVTTSLLDGAGLSGRVRVRDLSLPERASLVEALYARAGNQEVVNYWNDGFWL